jgi:hypothetical protein
MPISSDNPQEARTSRRAAERREAQKKEQEKVVQVLTAFGYKGRLITPATPAAELNEIPQSFLAAQVKTGAARWTDPDKNTVEGNPANPIPTEE